MARVVASKQLLPFLHPLIYPLIGPCFRDIVTGINGRYHAQPGHDLVTGLSVPNVQALAQSLP